MTTAMDRPADTVFHAGLTRHPEWHALRSHATTMGQAHLRDLFAADAQRGERLRVEAAGWYCDYSKQRVTDETLGLLLALASACQLTSRIEAMFRGEKLNTTEHHAALHTALRAPASAIVEVDGCNVVAQVHAVLARMTEFTDAVRSGRRTGYTGKRLRNIVNLGIGGSDLGPVMAFEALRHYSQRDMCYRFVSNVDASDFLEATRDLDPAETLFIICSKTFTTVETLTNAHAAVAWCLASLGDDKAIAQHFVAVSSHVEGARQFGIDPALVFDFWDWVGGRYSMNSAIGLSTMLAIGAPCFRQMLAGAHAMDEHFRRAPMASNAPLLLGLIGIWNTNFLNAPTVAVLPYAHYLKRFPAYLQQLAMESNGKHVTADGQALDYTTGPIYWGEPGTNGQHSFYQLLHQGTHLAPCDFIGFCRPLHPVQAQHDLLMANLFAQSEALAFGNAAAPMPPGQAGTALPAYREFDGNRPSTTLLARQLDPFALGALVALYEHSVLVQALVWNINPFDQWGVELGKALALRTAAELAAAAAPVLAHDSSTNCLIQHYRLGR